MKKNTKKNFNIIPPDLSAKEKALELAKKDIVTFGQMFLPEDFMKSTPAPYQYELSDILLGKDKRVCIMLGCLKNNLRQLTILNIYKTI